MFLLALSSLALAQPATTIDAPGLFDATDLVGSWVVRSTRVEGTCQLSPVSPEDGEVTTYVWILSATKTGEVKVTVQGETGFPKLTGSWSGLALSLRGPATSWTAAGWETQAAPCPGLLETPMSGPRVHYAANSLFSLEADGPGVLSGTRTYLGFTKATGTDGNIVYTPCVETFAIEAKQQ